MHNIIKHHLLCSLFILPLIGIYNQNVGQYGPDKSTHYYNVDCNHYQNHASQRKSDFLIHTGIVQCSQLLSDLVLHFYLKQLVPVSFARYLSVQLPGFLAAV